MAYPVSTGVADPAADAVATALGVLAAAKVTDPDAASASLLALLRGVLEGIQAAMPAGTNVIGRVGHDTTGLGDGVKTVTAAGTDEALAATTAVKWVIVQAQTDNIGGIAVGASGVDATEATGTGMWLEAGEAVEVLIDDLAKVFIDATESGEGVRFFYGT